MLRSVWLTAARISMLVWVIILAGVSPVAAKGAQIRLERTDFDFGEILQGESLERVFTFRNAGDENLVISKVRSSCGCTAALLSADVIPPGGTGEVRATFNSGNFRGKVEKSIYLTTNDPAQGSTVLRLRGRVLPLLGAPDYVDFGTFKAKERREVRIPLTNRSKEAITLTSVESTVPAVSIVKGAKSLPAGKEGEIVLRAEFAGSEPPSGYLLIRTNHPRVPELRLPFAATPLPR